MRKVEEFLRPVDKVARVAGEETVAAALGRISGTHEIALVYEKEKFLGIVWPYRMLFEGRAVRSAKVKSVTVRPPRLESGDDWREVARQMLASRAYTLPVFSGEKIVGVVRARDMLVRLVNEKEWLKKVEVREPFVAAVHDPLGKVWTRLRQKKRSRVIVVDGGGKLIGVVSRRDIYGELLAPPGGRQRYSTRGGGDKSLVFDEDWVKKMDYEVGKMVKRRSVWLESKAGVPAALNRLLRGTVGSVVLVDGFMRPAGVVSVRSFLKVMAAGDEGGEGVFVRLTDQAKVLGEDRRREVERRLVRFWERGVRHNLPLARVEMVVKGLKNAAGRAKLYEGTLEAVMKSGRKFVARVVQTDLGAVVREAGEKLERQLRKRR